MENTTFLWKFGLVTGSTPSSSTLRTIWIAPLLFSRATKFTYLNKVNYSKVTKKRYKAHYNNQFDLWPAQ